MGEVGVTLGTDIAPGFFNYPGIRVSSDHELVTPLVIDNFLFGLEHDTPTPLSVVLMADEALPLGTAVTFTIELVSLEEACGIADSVTVTNIFE